MAICPQCYSEVDGQGQCTTCEYRTRLPKRGHRILAAATALLAIYATFFILLWHNSADLRVQSVISQNHAVQIYPEVPPPESPVIQGTRPTLSLQQQEELRLLFEQERFAQLNQKIESLQSEFEQDPTREWQIKETFEIFSIPRVDYGLLLDTWAKITPEHFAPHMARAEYHAAFAAFKRGADLAKETSSEQFSGMRDYHAKALTDIDKALGLKPELLPAYIKQIQIYNAEGKPGLEDRTFRTGRQKFPTSYLLYSGYQWAKLPRWGGSYSEMNRIAAEAIEQAEENLELNWLGAQSLADKAWYKWREGAFAEAIELYTQAMVYGENAYLYQERGRVHYAAGDRQQALTDLGRSIELHPTRMRSYRHRASMLIAMHKTAEAIDDIIMAGRLSPGDPELDALQRWALSKLPNLIEGDALGKGRSILAAIAPAKPAELPQQLAPPRKIELQPTATAQNFLKNGSATNGLQAWKPYGEVEVMERGNNNFFSLRNGSSLLQDIQVTTTDVHYALLIGTMNSERIGDVTGLPYLWGSITNIDDKGKRTMNWLQGQNMRCAAQSPSEWAIGYGIFPIRPSAKMVQVKLAQAERKGTPQNGSAANFDDVGLYFFATEEEAKSFAESFQRSP